MIEDWIYTIPGWLTPHEGKFLFSSAKSIIHIPGTVVEIGSFQGKSTIFLAKAGVHVTAVDPHKGNVSGGTLSPTYKSFLTHLSRAHIQSLVHPVVATSKQAIISWKKPISYLFIDGLHDYTHAKEDYVLWSPFVIDGGIIAMHDAFCGWDGAGKVASESIVHGKGFREIGVVGSIIYGVKGHSSFIERIALVFRRSIIDLCQSIYKKEFIPNRIRFILVHKLLRILLLNRFSALLTSV